MRVRLSSNRLLLKIIMIPFLLVMMACTIATKQSLTIATGLSVLFFVTYLIFFAGKKIEFDKENMYIINRDGEKVIDLKNVNYIKKIGYYSFGLGRIEYYSEKKKW